MKTKKILIGALAAIMCMFSLTACSNGGDSGSSDSAGDSSVVSTSNEGNTKSTNDSESSDTMSDATSAPKPDKFRVAALKGPTAMGLVKLMDDNETNNYGYEFNIYAAPDEITPLVAKGDVDIACVPANLCSVLYNKTEGKVRACAVNTLGVLYICENGETVKSVSDLKGKTIYSAGKGSTPEYALNFILESNNIDPEKDVTIEWKSEHAECLQAMLTGENCVAMLPQPFVTTAQTKNENVKVVLDLNGEWDNLGLDSVMITGGAIVRKEFAEQYPEAVNEFLKRYADSVDYVNANVDKGAKLVGKYDIVPEAVAKKALPNCNIVCITGDELKTKLSGYLNVLYDNDPTAVGGKLPGDDFYYNNK